MNKFILLAAASVAAAGMAACSNSNNANNDNNNASAAGSDDMEVLYAGVLPAADADGTAYVLKLEYDDDHGFTEGDFTLTETTFTIDSITGAINEVASGYSEGDFVKRSKDIEGAAVEYIQLTPDAKDALGSSSTDMMYFIVNSDNTLTMVDADLNKAADDSLNYTLTAK